MTEEKEDKTENPSEETSGAGQDAGGESLDDQWGEAMAEQTSAEEAAPEADKAPEPVGAGAGAGPAQPEAPQPEASPASFGALKQGSVSGGSSSLEMILDIPVTVAVELGRTRMLVQDLLALGQGAVVELEKLAGETMEILVNGRLIARGEAVVVNEKFGVKLTDIVSPTERINKLK